MNEPENSFSNHENRSAGISSDHINSLPVVPSISPCSEHILNVELHFSKQILSRQSSPGNFDFNVDLEQDFLSLPTPPSTSSR